MSKDQPTFAGNSDELDGYRGSYQYQCPSVAEIQSKMKWLQAWRHP
jgi:hypothetical protein